MCVRYRGILYWRSLVIHCFSWSSRFDRYWEDILLDFNWYFSGGWWKGIFTTLFAQNRLVVITFYDIWISLLFSFNLGYSICILYNKELHGPILLATSINTDISQSILNPSLRGLTSIDDNNEEGEVSNIEQLDETEVNWWTVVIWCVIEDNTKDSECCQSVIDTCHSLIILVNIWYQLLGFFSITICFFHPLGHSHVLRRPQPASGDIRCSWREKSLPYPKRSG